METSQSATQNSPSNTDGGTSDQPERLPPPLTSRLESSLTSGQLMTSLSGGFMALNMKELKDELRLSKRAEQMAKDKLLEVKKQLEVQEEIHLKFK